MQNKERLFYSRKEAAEFLCCSLPSMARYLRDGVIPFTRIGGRVLIPAKFLDDLAKKAMRHEEVE